MAVFRIEKTRDYTVMSNHHLRDMSLSLKAKGLLSLMLSLPENWDYTMKGLARICKDGIDSISGGIRELEEHGYLIRERVRGANGQLGSIEYTILEQPKEPTPTQEKPIRENPVQANPTFAVAAEQPEKDNPLRTAEMTLEDDYGMIDGVINNGRRGEELEKAQEYAERTTPEKPSIRERLEDAKRECAEHKPPEGKKPGRDVPEHDCL